MTEYIQINLIDIIENKGEPFAKEILSSFLCPQNIDIEDFLKKKAIVMAKQNTSPTHLVYAPYKGKYVLDGLKLEQPFGLLFLFTILPMLAKAHPRLRGENSTTLPKMRTGLGSPPLTRGIS